MNKKNLKNILMWKRKRKPMCALVQASFQEEGYNVSTNGYYMVPIKTAKKLIRKYIRKTFYSDVEIIKLFNGDWITIDTKSLKSMSISYIKDKKEISDFINSPAVRFNSDLRDKIMGLNVDEYIET